MTQRYSTTHVRELLRKYYASLNNLNFPLAFSHKHYSDVCKLYDFDLLPWLPTWRDRPVLEIGCGTGYLTKYLIDKGFSKILINDFSQELLAAVKKSLGKQLSGAYCCEGRELLKSYNSHFGLIVSFDVIEHFTLSEAFEFLSLARKALIPGGIILIRTPNMSNILAGYLRYCDLTHEYGYTDFTLESLFCFSGFSNVKICEKKNRRTLKGNVGDFINKIFHNFIFRVQPRKMPRSFRTSLMLSAEKQSSEK